MTFDDVFQKLKDKFPQSAWSKEDTKPDPFIKIDPSQLHATLLYMKDGLTFESLNCISGVDYPAMPAIAVVYHMVSYTHKIAVCLKAFLPREGTPAIRSVCDLFKSANWLERETFDMFGVLFTGHPDLKRILCPDDWVGYPLRKDYQTPDYYNGMPVPLFFEDPSTKEGAATKEGPAAKGGQA